MKAELDTTVQGTRDEFDLLGSGLQATIDGAQVKFEQIEGTNSPQGVCSNKYNSHSGVGGRAVPFLNTMLFRVLILGRSFLFLWWTCIFVHVFYARCNILAQA